MLTFLVCTSRNLICKVNLKSCERKTKCSAVRFGLFYSINQQRRNDDLAITGRAGGFRLLGLFSLNRSTSAPA